MYNKYPMYPILYGGRRKYQYNEDDFLKVFIFNKLFSNYNFTSN